MLSDISNGGIQARHLYINRADFRIITEYFSAINVWIIRILCLQVVIKLTESYHYMDIQVISS